MPSADVPKRLLPLALIVLAFAAWNWRLLWSVSKPAVLQLAPQFISTEVQAAGEDGFAYPRLGISAPYRERATTSPLAVQQWKGIEDDLRQGLSLTYEADSFEDAPIIFVTGHSSDVYPHSYASVFASLHQAKVGDTFTLTRDGSTLSFTVREKKVVDPGDSAAFTAYASPSQIQTVLLVTCTPLLTARDRLVVVGERSIQ